jgi:hypothetical protein
MQTSLISRTPYRFGSIVGVLLFAGLTSAAHAQTYGTTSGRPAGSASPTYAAPPAPVQPAPAPARQAAPAAPPARSESKLPDLLYIQPFIGVGYANLKSFDSDNFDPEMIDPSADPTDFAKTTKGSGLRYGVAAGLNIIFLHLGGRVGFTQTNGFTLGTAQLEVALVPRLGPIEPSVRVGLGYAWLGDPNYTSEIKKATSVYGLALGAGLGLDARLGQVVGIGIALDADVLNMSRSTDPGTITMVRVEEGTAVGVQVAFTGHLTLHI